jgi:transcription-repair coupling factor (superfamily II helicase)
VDYIPDQTMRLKLYRRLADMQDEDEVQAMEDEFIDRFGALPQPVAKPVFPDARQAARRSSRAGLGFDGRRSDCHALPALPEGASRHLPNLGTGYALWQECLLDAGWRQMAARAARSGAMRCWMCLL